AQALHLLNSNEVQGKLADVIAKDSKRADAEKVEALFLWVFARKPTSEQMQAALAHINQHAKDKKIAYEDILWALTNKREFVGKGTPNGSMGMIAGDVDRSRWPSIFVANYEAEFVHRSLLYQRPTFTSDQRVFTDLLAYAPGMNTSRADVLAVLEAEAGSKQIATGSIDPAARKLIDKARSAGWRVLTTDAGTRGLTPPARLVFDGA